MSKKRSASAEKKAKYREHTRLNKIKNIEKELKVANKEHSDKLKVNLEKWRK